ncbi:hypothetical protein B0T24DRAFT_632920 [Lasiosphaeria ovina]|uniref:Short chain dehydrogenase n=1 Tax=Lasiosphaeria ovina TaxID=92902 RepID=A0AAE0K5C1_9PEZI|nr:hypothetical protein B0T24DRAFT_632920 [Lasiosphaeria ovina]
MSSYVIIGTSRGLGYEFVRQYSSNPANTVIGLVRNKAATEKKISEDADLKSRSNVHILEGDLVDYAGLKKAAADTAKITGGSVDYLIANAAFGSQWDAYDGIGKLGADPERLAQELQTYFDINVLGNINFINLFMPLVLKGKVKKVIALTTGYSDIPFTNEVDVASAPLYSISKAALNMVVAKFSAEYKKHGVLVMAVAPGIVDVGQFIEATEEQTQGIQEFMGKLLKYAPHFTGPDKTPDNAVRLMRGVIDNASIENGNAGDYLSQLGNKRWL